MIGRLINRRFLKNRKKSKKTNRNLRDAHLTAIAPELNRLYKTLTDTLFLNVAVVRDVLSYLGEDQYGWFEGFEFPERTKELYEAADKVEALRQAITATTVNDAKDFIAKAKYQDVATEVRHKADQAGKLVEGQPAIDIMMTDVDGNTKHLSEFLGESDLLGFVGNMVWSLYPGISVFRNVKQEIRGERHRFPACIYG